jgi:hypothetical protein
MSRSSELGFNDEQNEIYRKIKSCKSQNPLNPGSRQIILTSSHPTNPNLEDLCYATTSPSPTGI